MNKQKKIAWQKYEDVIKEQINSPIIKDIIEEVKQQNIEFLFDEDEPSDNDGYEEPPISNKVLISIPENVLNEAALASTFDCWIGHTNFDITEGIKNKVNRVEGVEILKIHSRYRFFIGVGKMFDFSNVRQDIEKTVYDI